MVENKIKVILPSLIPYPYRSNTSQVKPVSAPHGPLWHRHVIGAAGHHGS